MLLVEARVFLKITLFFLAKGHAKNACDRMLDLVRREHHARNMCAYDELRLATNEKDRVDADRT